MLSQFLILAGFLYFTMTADTESNPRRRGWGGGWKPPDLRHTLGSLPAE